MRDFSEFYSKQFPENMSLEQNLVWPAVQLARCATNIQPELWPNYVSNEEWTTFETMTHLRLVTGDRGKCSLASCVFGGTAAMAKCADLAQHECE